VNHELICSWLKVPPTAWPPDHYTLLGLNRGESDAARIERHVQLRMEWVRCYQLTHAELVTEAMNRLAQAFDCLRDPLARQAYDARLAQPATGAKKATDTSRPIVEVLPAVFALAAEPEKPPPASTPNTNAPTLPGGASVESAKDPLAWLYAPGMAPPVRSATRETIDAKLDKTTLEMPIPGAPPAETNAATDATGAPPLAPEEPVDPALQAARSAPARRGLGTKRAIYQRISRTRKLIRAWVQSGKYLGEARFELKEKAEAIDLVRQLTIIRQQLRDFPPLLGQAGQPGYLVIALARQPEIVKTFQALSPSQRKSYVRDWQAGLTFLAAYRLYLREELWNLRRQTRVGRMLRALAGLFTDYPALWLGLFALLIANIAFRSWRAWWPVETLGVVVLLAGIVIYRNLSRRQSFHRSRRRPPPAAERVGQAF
jgi:hypothetical protein